ncbi:MAG: hypothetical protein ACTSRU_12950 [Candidatus Hodarchaeales archaeon]
MVDIIEFCEALEIIKKYDEKAELLKGGDHHYQAYVWLSDQKDFKSQSYLIDDESHDGCPTFSDEDNKKLFDLGWWFTGCSWTHFW